MAHVATLQESVVIDAEASAALMSAIDRVSPDRERSGSLVEVLAAFDERLEALSPPAVAGAASVGRSTAEVIAAAVRLILRDDLVAFGEQLDWLRAALIDMAGTHAVSLMPALSGGQAAQPTTFGHYLGGVIGPLGRAAERLRTAFSVINMSPLGAGALAGVAVELDRSRPAELLAFDSRLDNTFDAVAAVDQFLALSDVVGATAAAVGRFLYDILAWLRKEPECFRLDSDWISSQPGVPQLQAPVALIDLAFMAKSIVREAETLRSLAGSLPYEPVVVEAEQLLARAVALVGHGIELSRRAERLIASGLDVNRALLANRAGKSFSTISDLADFLMIEEQLDPATARNLASLTLARAKEQGLEASGITAELIDSAALLVIGREVKVEFEAISRYLAPRRFIERRAGQGGPAPDATRAYLDRERRRLDADARWRRETQERFSAAMRELEGLSAVEQ
jgi:argininosuccinate lyase